MTYIAASRDALTAAIHAATWPDGSTDGFPTSRVAKMIADALIASGAVIDAATLADDEALIADTAYALAEGEATYAASTVRHVLRALAAALTERTR